VRVPPELGQARDKALEGETVALGEPASGGVEHKPRTGHAAGGQEDLHHGPHAERLADTAAVVRDVGPLVQVRRM